MLDRASLDRLSRSPEKNAPMLNVALAEEGPADVLVALARSHGVGPEALDVISARIDAEGADVGRDREGRGDPFTPVDGELDRMLIEHPRAAGETRDAVLARHPDDAFFVLAAACHPGATLTAIERAIDWAPASPVHDRLWLALIDPARVPPMTLEEWTQDANPNRREAAARITRDPEILERLAEDRSRQVRRAVASNRSPKLRERLSRGDPAVEVRARAASPQSAHGEAVLPEGGTNVAHTARFAAAYRVMASGGLVAPDVVRALSSSPNDLDPEGALLAGLVLPRKELIELVDRVVDAGAAEPLVNSLAAGIALRAPVPHGSKDDDAALEEGEHTELVYDTVKSLSRLTTSETRLTGKARLAAWAAEGFARSGAVDRQRLIHDLARRPLASERMILARGLRIRPELTRELCEEAGRVDGVPGALVELAWGDPSVPDARVIEIAARVAKPKQRAEDLPEDEVDLDPSLRSLEVLERVVLATTQRANISPRAALAAVALDARRVRYVLSAMPQWKGRLTGGRLARVLRQHAGALTAAEAESRARKARVEGWTERLLSELELAVALAVGHLTGAEVARRILSGRQHVEDGLTIAFGAEARAALEGPGAVLPIVEWATKHRTTQAPALAIWLLLEKLDRERGSTLIASSLDSLASGKGVVPAGVCDALAAIEHRSPGRLETIHPQSPRGRATLASAIARAYRAIGGMRHERQG